MDSQNSRDCGSPTLIMEVVGDEEENKEEEQEEGVVRTTKISTSHPGKHDIRQKCINVPKENLIWF